MEEAGSNLPKDFSWRTPTVAIEIVGKPFDPTIAFKRFVQPSLGEAEWIEDLNDVEETTMSKREWMGLILHAMALSKITSERLRVAMLHDENSYGCLVRDDDEVVYVAQALASHRETKKFTTLLHSINEQLGRSRKFFSRQDYPKDAHLVIFCDLDVTLHEDTLAKAVSQNKFSIVNIIVYDDEEKRFSSFIFSKEKPEGAIYKASVSGAELVAWADELST